LTRVFADLHIHGRYSMSTSPHTDTAELARWGAIKGLGIIGTGDFTHPEWQVELKNTLREVDATGLYVVDGSKSQVKFIVTGEVSTIWRCRGRVKRIHHLLLAPSLEDAEEISRVLQQYGRLAGDGRPMLKASAPEILRIILEASPGSAVIPAHVWTPYNGLFASGTGFDSVEDCYGDLSHLIIALETGLSSDPTMNWRVSSLDRFALVSNSDCHSPWPWRLGREANIFNIHSLYYSEIVEAIGSKDPERFTGTIEVYPAYGKYHWSGHRKCGVSMPPEDAAAAGGVCPICGKPLTRGVADRVEELADREKGFKPDGAIGFRHLIPLHEVIARVEGVATFNSKKVWHIYNHLIERFGNEYAVFLDAPLEELGEAVGDRLARVITAIRDGRISVRPGYDGVYGKLLL
jgi:uncharacterized protein (TIGR00375 family)